MYREAAKGPSGTVCGRDQDPVGDCGKAVRRVADKYKGCGMEHVECVLYPGMRHEILNENGREKVEQDVAPLMDTKDGGLQLGAVKNISKEATDEDCIFFNKTV